MHNYLYFIIKTSIVFGESILWWVTFVDKWALEVPSKPPSHNGELLVFVELYCERFGGVTVSEQPKNGRTSIKIEGKFLMCRHFK